MNCKNRIITSVVILLLYYQGYSKSIPDKNLISFTTEINTNDAYDIRFSYHNMIYPFWGIGIGLGNFSQWTTDNIPFEEEYDTQWTSWHLSESNEKITKLYFTPSLLFYSPYIINREKFKVSLMVEPGLLLIIPHSGVYIKHVNSITNDSKTTYISTNQGDWCFWNVKTGIDFKFNECSITLGYGISNLDIYSSRRHLQVSKTLLGKFYPKKDLTHSLFLRFTYSF